MFTDRGCDIFNNDEFGTNIKETYLCKCITSPTKSIMKARYNNDIQVQNSILQNPNQILIYMTVL